jgi:hypothetical protein
MNWWRGLFRLWLGLSVMWWATCLVMFFFIINRDFDDLNMEVGLVLGSVMFVPTIGALIFGLIIRWAWQGATANR